MTMIIVTIPADKLSLKQTRHTKQSSKGRILPTRSFEMARTSRNSPGPRFPSVYAPKSVRMSLSTCNPTKPRRIFTSWY